VTFKSRLGSLTPAVTGGLHPLLDISLKNRRPCNMYITEHPKLSFCSCWYRLYVRVYLYSLLYTWSPEKPIIYRLRLVRHGRSKSLKVIEICISPYATSSLSFPNYFLFRKWDITIYCSKICGFTVFVHRPYRCIESLGRKVRETYI